mmetsp:Transcript_55037/g.147373  ORF Transcript_55037/g.147373 Transcript_55037/m.147373 type:complete len:116 (+) Transcript_55037:218-565(+)
MASVTNSIEARNKPDGVRRNRNTVKAAEAYIEDAEMNNLTMLSKNFMTCANIKPIIEYVATKAQVYLLYPWNKLLGDKLVAELCVLKCAPKQNRQPTVYIRMLLTCMLSSLLSVL